MKLVWDAIGARNYETGVDRGVLFPQNSDGTYGHGVAWNGLTAVNESPSGADPTDFYADNIKYASIRSAETFGYTIEAYTYPDEFAACDGSAEPVKGVLIGQQNRNPFGFSYRTLLGNDTASETDDGYLLHLVYNGTASPSERSYQTVNDSPDAITFSWEVATTPINVPGYKPTATMVINSTKVDKDKLAALEAKLYGTDDAEGFPTLPLPAEVIEMFGDTPEEAA